MPASMRPAVVAIYRFARSADDLADEGDAPPEQRLEALARYDAALTAIGRGESPPAPPFPALAEAIRAHRLPLAPFHDLLSAFAQDVTVKRYADYASLEDYCRRSANPVGRLLLSLYDAQTPANMVASDAICTGLQLTNFWQDVAIDWRKERVYLPQDDLRRFGVDEADIEAQRADSRWGRLMRHEVARARSLLESGRTLPRALPWRIGLELAAVIAGGLRILQRIDQADGDVFTRRPALRRRDWCVVAFQALRHSGRSGA